jgi:nitrogenase iron protein NifH
LFAAPLRKGIGEKVVIVASEEVMALYAANNIAKAVCHYAANGIVLAGMIVNLRDNQEDRTPVERFAKLINTDILGYVPRDPLIREAEYRRQAVVEYAPHSPIAKVFRELAQKIMAIDPASCALPTPLTETLFHEYTRCKFDVPARGAAAPPVVPTIAREPEEPDDGLVAPTQLLGPRVQEKRAAAQAAQESESARRAAFAADMLAGMRAVRLGRVRPGEALRRLRTHYPAEAANLIEADLVS